MYIYIYIYIYMLYTYVCSVCAPGRFEGHGETAKRPRGAGRYITICTRI